MNYCIYDNRKLYYHLYWKYIIFGNLIRVKKINKCRNLNVIFIVSELDDFFDYCNLNNSNNVILVIEDPFLVKKITTARNVEFFKLSDVLKKHLCVQNNS